MLDVRRRRTRDDDEGSCKGMMAMAVTLVVVRSILGRISFLSLFCGCIKNSEFWLEIYIYIYRRIYTESRGVRPDGVIGLNRQLGKQRNGSYCYVSREQNQGAMRINIPGDVDIL